MINVIWIHISLQLCSCRTSPHGTTPDRLQCQALSNLIICHLTLLLNHNCKISPHCAIGVATKYTHYLCWIDTSTFWPYNHGMASQLSDRNPQEQTLLITTPNEVAERQFFSRVCQSVCSGGSPCRALPPTPTTASSDMFSLILFNLDL